MIDVFQAIVRVEKSQEACRVPGGKGMCRKVTDPFRRGILSEGFYP